MERIIGFIKTPPPTPIMDPNKPATRPTTGLYLRAFLIEASCERKADADDTLLEASLDALDAVEANDRVATVAVVRQHLAILIAASIGPYYRARCQDRSLQHKSIKYY